MTRYLRCEHCGRWIEVTDKYGMAKKAVHPECEAAAKAGVDFNAELDLGDDFDELWAEFCQDRKARKALAEGAADVREAMAMVDAEKQLDEPVVPGGYVTRRDLTRYAKEVVEDFPAYVAKHATDARPWWAKLFLR